MICRLSVHLYSPKVFRGQRVTGAVLCLNNIRHVEHIALSGFRIRSVRCSSKIRQVCYQAVRPVALGSVRLGSVSQQPMIMLACLITHSHHSSHSQNSLPPSPTLPLNMAYSATRRRPGTSAPGDGSRTITIHDSQPGEDDGEGSSSGSGERNVVGALRLRGGPKKKSQRRVVWDDDVVDNEGCGRKSSKSTCHPIQSLISHRHAHELHHLSAVCCIYHKPKRFDESSDEDSTDTDSDSDCGHDHRHDHAHQGDSGGGMQAERSGGSSTTVEQYEPNAYEQAPSSKKKGKHLAV